MSLELLLLADVTWCNTESQLILTVNELRQENLIKYTFPLWLTAVFCKAMVTASYFLIKSVVIMPHKLVESLTGLKCELNCMDHLAVE